jgi:hypothetical protein
LENEINTKHVFWFIIAFLVVFIGGLFIDVINIDAAQYAEISREMKEGGNFLQVHLQGRDYLDKPPLLFWLSAFSFKIFGIHNWSYKLPSFLFAILGIYSTKKIGELLYDVKTGMVAALMLISSLGILIMTNDIRTDTILLGSTIFATWQLLVFTKTKSWKSLILGFVGVGLAMLAKGPLGLVLPAMAVGSELVYKREWKKIFQWQWLVGLVIVAIVLFPMCYGLYEQFDLHPEKTVNEETGVSGLKFYFWTQSFGRITGSSQWGTKFDNGAGPFFFTHTFLWTFFPWCLLVVGGLIESFIVLIRNKFRKDALPELLSVGGFVLIFIALSASRYKLPHYIFVTLPFAAIIASRFLLHTILTPSKKMLLYLFQVLHWKFFAAMTFLICIFLFSFFSGASWWKMFFAFSGLILGIFLAIKAKGSFQKLMYPLLAALLSLFFVADFQFYPELLKYEATAVAGQLIADKKIPADDVFTYNDVTQFALDFYSRENVVSTNLDSIKISNRLKKYGAIYFYTDKEGYDKIKTTALKISRVTELNDYSIQFLTLNFLKPSSRNSVLRKRYLLEVNGVQ